jgi:hypothetical protein
VRPQLPKNHERIAAGSDVRALGYYRADASAAPRRIAAWSKAIGGRPADTVI